MNVALRYSIRGRTASEVADSVEAALRAGRIAPGALLPAIRDLAAALGVSPATAASAYRTLRTRGLVNAQGRGGTRVNPRPPLAALTPPEVPPDRRNLADGNPDPALLPPLGPALARARGRSALYGAPAKLPELVRLASREFQADGIPARPMAVVGGALDGIERALQAHLRPGDRVAVEDPGYAGVLDLVGALGLVVEPVGVDDSGPRPGDVRRALASGSRALILTPRAQNPTGAALDERRSRELGAVLQSHPDVLLVEDDHAGPIAGAPALTLCRHRRRFAVVRSVSKSLGPDLRLAVVAGDEETLARMEGRQAVATGWVSRILQTAVAALWADPATDARLRSAAGTYAGRRRALIQALADRAILAHGRSGLNVWVPVPEEAPVVAALAEAGYAVRAGERFRMKSPPAIRITVSSLSPSEAQRIADILARTLRPGLRAPVA